MVVTRGLEACKCVTVLYIKWDSFRVSNYQSVMWTFQCYKLQEHILTSKILKHLDRYSILTDFQHVFWVKSSSETQLLILAHEFALSTEKRQQQDPSPISRKLTLTLSLVKTFNKVGFLWYLKDNTLIDKDLTFWQNTVIVDGATWERTGVVNCVAQRTVLRPLLFSILSTIYHTCVWNSQDKTRSWWYCFIQRGEIKDQDDAELLQKDLRVLDKWEEKWGMSDHPDKCTIPGVTR